MRKWMRISPLGQRLIIAVFLLSGIVTVASSAIMLWFDYRDGIERYEKTLQQVVQGYEDSLANSLWTYDLSQLQALAQGVFNFPGIRYVQIDNDNTLFVQLGDLYAPTNKKLTIELYHQDGDERRFLGNLRLGQSYDDLYQTLYRRALDIMLSQLFLSLAVGLLALTIIHQLVTRRLLKLTRWARHFSLNNLDLEPPLHKLGPHDELGLVVDAINQMRHTLKADLQLREQEQTQHNRLKNQLTLAVNNAELGFCRYSVSLNQFDCNDHFATQLGLAVDEVAHLKQPMEHFYQRVFGEQAEQQIQAIRQLLQGKRVFLHDRYQLNSPTHFVVLDISFQVVSYDNSLPENILICCTNRSTEHDLQYQIHQLKQEYELQFKELESACERTIKSLRDKKNTLNREARRLRMGQQPKHIQALSQLMQEEIAHCQQVIPSARLAIWREFLALNFYKKLKPMDLSKTFHQHTEKLALEHNLDYRHDLPLSLIIEEDPEIIQFLFNQVLHSELLQVASALSLKIRLAGPDIIALWELTGNFAPLDLDNYFTFKLANIICNMRYDGVFTAQRNADQLTLSIRAPFTT